MFFNSKLEGEPEYDDSLSSLVQWLQRNIFVKSMARSGCWDTIRTMVMSGSGATLRESGRI